MQLGYKQKTINDNEKTMMGGIREFISTIDPRQNMIFETGRHSEKQHEAIKIYKGIFKHEKIGAKNLASCLSPDINTWLAKNESYVNLRTAQIMRQRINDKEEARRKVEKDVVLDKPDKETEAERLIREYKIKVREPEKNCGPQMVDICT